MQLPRAQIPDVVCHDCLGASCNRQLDEMVVSLVSEIRSPPVINTGPPADAQQAIQDGFSLGGVEAASLEQLGSGQERLVLSEERCAHERSNLAAEASTQYGAAGARGAKESRDKDASVQNDDHTGDDSVYAITSWAFLPSFGPFLRLSYPG